MTVNRCVSTVRADEHGGPFEFAIHIYTNGDRIIRRRCQGCGKLVGPALTRHRFTGNELDAMPIARDSTKERPPCVRCGAWGSEEHHWAPRALFTDADLWPTSWLCRQCHRLWHDVTGVAI